MLEENRRDWTANCQKEIGQAAGLCGHHGPQLPCPHDFADHYPHARLDARQYPGLHPQAQSDRHHVVKPSSPPINCRFHIGEAPFSATRRNEMLPSARCNNYSCTTVSTSSHSNEMPKVGPGLHSNQTMSISARFLCVAAMIPLAWELFIAG